MPVTVSQDRKDAASRDISRIDVALQLVTAAVTADQASRGTTAAQLTALAAQCESQALVEEVGITANRVSDPNTSADEFNLAIEHLNNQREFFGRIAEPLPEYTKGVLQALTTSTVGGAIASATIAGGSFTAGVTGIGKEGIEEAEKTAAGIDATTAATGITAGEKARTVLLIGGGLAAIIAIVLAVIYGKSILKVVKPAA